MKTKEEISVRPLKVEGVAGNAKEWQWPPEAGMEGAGSSSEPVEQAQS